MVFDVFTREGWSIGEDHAGNKICLGPPGETWLATLSDKELAVDLYSKDEIVVIRPREGEASECEDLDYD